MLPGQCPDACAQVRLNCSLHSLLFLHYAHWAWSTSPLSIGNRSCDFALRPEPGDGIAVDAETLGDVLDCVAGQNLLEDPLVQFTHRNLVWEWAS